MQNLQVSKTLVIENRLVVAKGERGRGGMDWEFGQTIIYSMDKQQDPTV